MSRILDHNGRPFQLDAPARGVEAPFDEFALPHVITFAGLMNYSQKVYYQRGYDEARKKDPRFAQLMRNDCFLMGLMQERTLAVTDLPWHLEVEDEKDERQRFVRDHLTKTLRHGWRMREMRYNLLHETAWYGRAAEQLKYVWTTIDGIKTLQVADWMPVNGDKITHTWDHCPIVNVNSAMRDRILAVDPDAEFRWTDYNLALALRGTWRERFLVHSHHSWDADFLDGALAAENVHGSGVRAAVYWWDWIRLEWISKVSDYMDRVGLGLTCWYYELGNDLSFQEVKRAAETQSNKLNVLLPRSNQNKGQGLERIETPIAGAEAITKIVEHIEEYVRHYITGQNMSTGGQGGELGGSGRAKFAESTKQKIAAHDAANFDETMTGNAQHFGLVHYLQANTFPLTLPGQPEGFAVRFVTDVEDPQSKDRLDAIQTVVSLGVPTRASEARAAAGLSQPTGDDELVPGAVGMDPGGQEEPGAAGGGDGPDNHLQHGPKGGLYELLPGGSKKSVPGGAPLTNRSGVHSRTGGFKSHGGSGLHGGRMRMDGRPDRMANAEPPEPNPEEEAALAQVEQALHEAMITATGATIQGKVKPPVKTRPAKREEVPPPEEAHADLLHRLAEAGLHGEALRVFREMEPEEAAAVMDALTPEALAALKRAVEDEKKADEPPDRKAMPPEPPTPTPPAPAPAKPKRSLRAAVAEVVKSLFGRKVETKDVTVVDGVPVQVVTTTEYPDRYVKDPSGHEHVGKGSPEGGQFGTGGGGGGDSAPKHEPQPVGPPQSKPPIATPKAGEPGHEELVASTGATTASPHETALRGHMDRIASELGLTPEQVMEHLGKVYAAKEKPKAAKTAAEEEPLAAEGHAAVASFRSYLDGLSQMQGGFGEAKEKALKPLEGLSDGQMKAVLKELKIPPKGKSRKGAIEAVRQVLTNQTEMHVKYGTGLNRGG